MKTIQKFTLLFFAIAIIEAIAELVSFSVLSITTRPLVIISLGLLYIKTAQKINKWYLVALFFALLDNTFFAFDEQDQFIVPGMMAFTLYYLCTIIIIKQEQKRVQIIPVLLAISPFLIISFNESHILLEYVGDKLWAIMSCGVVIAIFFGLALYSHFLYSNKKTTYLLISAIFIILSATTYAVDQFYYNLTIFKISIILGDAFTHFTFYKFLVTKNDQKVIIDFQ